MFPADKTTEYYNDFYPEYNANPMQPTTSTRTQPRLSLDSGLGLTNDSFYSTNELNETQLMDITAASASDNSFNQSGPLELEQSPPTKWARIRTPPNRRKLDSSKEPSRISLFSPPSQKKMRNDFSSPTPSLKTPESLRTSIRISSPSPFKVTFSKTPLKLSNNENVTGFHIGKSGAYYNKKVNGSASKRCLLPARPDGFTLLGSPNSDVLDVPLHDPIMDFFDETAFESPTKIFRDLEPVNDGTMNYHQYSSLIESGISPSDPLLATTPLPSTSFENLKEPYPIKRTASRNLVKTTNESFAVVTHHPLPMIPMIKQTDYNPEQVVEIEQPKKKKNPAVKKLPIKSKQEIKEEQLKKVKEKEMKAWKLTPFETPKKEVPLYSGRWLVISTGRTLAQQELLADAKRFLRTLPPKPQAPPAAQSRSSRPSNRPIPTIARVTLFKHRYRSLRA